jgi:hypothetical protein
MKRQVKVIIAFTILVGLFIPHVSAQTYTGVVSVDTVMVLPGQQAVVPVRLSNNNLPISSLIVRLKYGSSDLSVDSVSFVGSMLPSDFDGYWSADNTEKKVNILYQPQFTTPIPVLTDTNGIVATIFFSVSPLAASGSIIPVDSINLDSLIGTDTHIQIRIEATDNTGLVIYLPDFIPGAVVVQSPTAVDEDGGTQELPVSFGLSQNYPNPFNPATVIQYTIPRAGHVRLDVFNILGQNVARLVDRRMPAGSYEVEFNGSRLPSGIYFYRLTHPEGSLTRKMTLLK